MQYTVFEFRLLIFLLLDFENVPQARIENAVLDCINIQNSWVIYDNCWSVMCWQTVVNLASRRVTVLLITLRSVCKGLFVYFITKYAILMQKDSTYHIQCVCLLNVFSRIWLMVPQLPNHQGVSNYTTCLARLAFSIILFLVFSGNSIAISIIIIVMAIIIKQHGYSSHQKITIFSRETQKRK